MPGRHGFHWTSRANQSFELGCYPAELRMGAKAANLTALVSVDMLPTPRVIIEGESAESPFRIPADLSETAELTFNDLKGTVGLVISRADVGSTFTFTALPREPVVTLGSMGSVSRIEGVALNFSNFYDARPGSDYFERVVVLQSAEWVVTLSANPHVTNMVEQLTRESGYGITHTWKISRGDDLVIAPRDVIRIENALRYFLSFARGSNCGLGLITGYAVDNEVAWQRWGFSHTNRWSHGLNWFSSAQGRFLRDLFPGFIREWSGNQNEHIRSALDMYVEATRNEPDVKPSLMLAQAALELLSWLKFVDSGTLSSGGFKKLPADDQIRLLLGQLTILRIPAELAQLANAAKSRSLDGPGILTQVRNSLVHPGAKASRSLTDEVVSQAWEIAMWYLDLSLLHLFGYRQEYCNRLKAMRGIRPAVEPVPWA